MAQSTPALVAPHMAPLATALAFRAELSTEQGFNNFAGAVAVISRMQLGKPEHVTEVVAGIDQQIRTLATSNFSYRATAMDHLNAARVQLLANHEGLEAKGKG